jgi:hypothetical protein
MLTATSNISFPNGYQDTAFAKDTSTPASKNEDASRTQTDAVSLSQKSQELQQTYKKKKSVLEQSYISDAQQLENKYLQEKNRLETELSQKKKSLEINVYV